MSAADFPILTEAGEITYVSLDPALIAGFQPLPIQHERYFAINRAARCVPVASLVFSRARPDGIRHANELMREAAAGRHDRRGPITVHPIDEGRFRVIDGNSTAINALLSGWSDIPANIEAAPSKRDGLG